MLVRNLLRLKPASNGAPLRNFSAPAKEVYDWRDDLKFNSDITTTDPRYRAGQIHPEKMGTPYMKEAEQWSLPPLWNRNDLTFNYKQDLIGHLTLKRPQACLYWTPEADFAHEIDYASEDLDFQPEDFKTQHFKKKGPITGWLFFGLLPFWYLANEYLAQGFPDRDHWKTPLPPPTDFPDEETPDSEVYYATQTAAGRIGYDSGMVRQIHYDIVDGKKIHKRYAGINMYMSPDV